VSISRNVSVVVLGLCAYAALAAHAGAGRAASPNAAQYVLIAAPTSVAISTAAVSISARGDVTIELSCPAGALEGCRGAVTITPRVGRSRGVPAGCRRDCRLGSARYEARAGRRTRVRVHISRSARSLLVRRRAVRVTVTATTVSGGHTTAVARTIVMRTRASRA
jgi:hypothetical protein